MIAVEAVEKHAKIGLVTAKTAATTVPNKAAQMTKKSLKTSGMYLTKTARHGGF